MGKIPTGIVLLVCLGTVWADTAQTTSVDALIEAGHWKRARQISAGRIAANPNDAQAHAWLSKTLSGFGDLTSALREAERAVELDGRNPAFHGQLAEVCALIADRSNVVKGLSYVRRMKRELEAAYAIDPSHVDTLLVEMMFSWKAPALAGGDKRKAHRVADHILSVSPVWGYLAQARLFQLESNDPQTEAVLKKAVQADPAFYRARVSFAEFYCGEQNCVNPAAAERLAREAIQVDRGAAAAYDVLARALAGQQNRAGELDSVLSQAAAQVPDDLGPYYAAAKRLVEAGQDYNRAERYIQQYLGQPAEGRQPTHAEARVLLAELYQRSGRKSDAFRELQMVLQQQPDFEPARRDLNRLRRM